MKNLKYITIALLLVGTWACDEDKWLEEKPLSTYSVANSYETAVQFRQGLNFLYDNLREMYWTIGDQTIIMNMADIAYGGTDYPDLKFNNFNIFVTPTTYVTGTY